MMDKLGGELLDYCGHVLLRSIPAYSTDEV
jgi:hypothetical protein